MSVVGRRVGVMGGSFDPVHVGHLVAASEVMGVCELDEVVFVVSATPPHKQHRELAPAEHRHAMVMLATAGNPRFTVSRIELDRPGLSYTYDTLEALQEERGEETELVLITGADVLPQIPSWHRGGEILERFQLVGVHRGGAAPSIEGLPPERVTICPLPALTMSSTEIRRRILADEPVWYWLPEHVLVHIGKHGMYGASWGYGAQG